MPDTLSQNTQATLLLTAPLSARSPRGSLPLVTPARFQRIVALLLQANLEPADFLGPQREETLDTCLGELSRDDAHQLLDRGLQLSRAVQQWQSRSIWLLSQEDANYPRRIRERLGKYAPVVLYGSGDSRLLNSGGLAVVGSRNAGEDVEERTVEVARLSASAGVTIVSGGAKGVDQISMRGALNAGGTAIGMLADSLERKAIDRANRTPLMEGRMVLVSPYDPGARFFVGNAMQRNKLIYALADAALVMNADYEKGGTWSGAVEQLDKWHSVPMYVRSSGERSKALEALVKRGAHLWPQPDDSESLRRVVADKPRASRSRDKQLTFRLEGEAAESPSAAGHHSTD